MEHLAKLFCFSFFCLNIQNVFLEDFCDREKCTADTENKYSEALNNRDGYFLSLIENALEDYKPCVKGNCSCHLPSLINDLKPFKKTGITKQMFDNVRKSGTKYQIISGVVYREEACPFPARCSGVEHFLLPLAARLPSDLELLLNTRDWPQLPRQRSQAPPGPVLSFSKTSSYWDVMYPAWSFWEGGPAISLYPTGLGRWDQHRRTLSQDSDRWPWESKKPLAFFRGSRTSSERDALILLSRLHPELVDAQYTKNQAWKSDADTLHQPAAAEVSLSAHCQYKYLVNYRGVAASFRLRHLFLCGSLVLHVGDQWQEFFYMALKPWVHYVPIHSDATQEDIRELLSFLSRHDSVASAIAQRGRQHIWDNLRSADVSCYWRRLLHKYAKLQNYTITRDPQLMEITLKT